MDGIYEIIQFLPTKFFPAKDSSGYDLLPLEEADMMIGQEITIKEDFSIHTIITVGQIPGLQTG